MTAADFTKHDANRSDLRKVLDTPILQQAFAVLRGELSPSVDSVAKLNPVLGAALYQQVAGMNHILNGLERLTQLHTERVVPRGKRLATEEDLLRLKDQA